MRVWHWGLALAAAVTLLLGLGCTQNEVYSLSGTVRAFGGAALPGVTVRLVSAIRTPTVPEEVTGAGGAFTFESVPAGLYTVEVTNAIPRTIYGPVQVTSDTTGLTIAVPTTAELPAGVSTPTNGTATVVLYLAEPNGAAVGEFEARLGNLAPLTATAGGPIVLTGLAPGSYDIVLGDTQTGRSVVLQQVAFAPNTVTVVRGQLLAPLVAPVAGQVVDDAGAARTGATIRLCRDGGTVGIPTQTSSTGRFTLCEIGSGDGYLLDACGPDLVRTWYGPFAIGDDNRRDMRLLAPTPAHVRETLGLTAPADGTATLVVYAVRPDGSTCPVRVATNAGRPCPAANPAVIDNLVPAPVLVTATVDGCPDAVRAEYVSVLANQLTILRIPWPQA